MNDGIPVPFFGRPAMTAPALAVLALRFDCDVLPLGLSDLMAHAFASRSFRRCPCRAAASPMLTPPR
jgi:hypothetical protein